ncbi:hypothetical protein B0A49_04616 [Cryomyces minteri]|uniref:ATP-dependent DNA helicase II subunit 2 n=1 Tax=Cryomyces minteri TaxID=331657 RepID=A0A4U0X0D0_9PEZI|nr:hypothetical protein B0A49_04616 [Cryomyces minteri]
MAQKDSTVYIIDVGASMAQQNGGRQETDLDWAMRYVWDKITSTVALDRKTALVGVLGLRTDGTDNLLDSEDSFQHISVSLPISRVQMPELRKLRSLVKPSNTDDGDAISAIVIAIQMIDNHCKKLQYSKRIILVTNGRSVMDDEDVPQIASKLKEDNIELIIIGVDFDDPLYGYKEEDKDETKAHNEQIFESLARACNGVYGTMAQAIDELSIPRIKPVRPVHSYKGFLTLGNPEEYDSAMAVDVERYPRTSVARPPTASQFVVRSDMAPGESSMSSSSMFPNGSGEGAQNQDGLAAVKNARTYQISDEEAPGGKRDVEREELAKGYEYGRTAVHIAESDENVTTYETRKGLDIIGFVPREKYQRYMGMSKTNVIIAQKTNDKASMALSSFVHSLYELDSYAIARFVRVDNSKPQILLLAPSIEPGFECLTDVELPFAEDIRSYRFPPLDRVITVSGKTIKEHQNLPNNDLMNAMSDYVDSMDLSTFGRDDEGQPTEYMPLEDTYSPTLHRVNQVIRWRAIHPNDEIPPVPEIFIKYSNPPDELIQKAQRSLDAMLAAGGVKKVPPKALHSRKRGRDMPKPLSGLNVTELLGRERRTRISPDNAIPEFKQLLAAAEDVTTIQDATQQMAAIVQSLIRYSVGDSGYGRAVEAIRVMREELVDLEEPECFNAFLRELKRMLLAGELGGERREMWWLIRVNKLGLVDKRACHVSSVDPEEAKAFLSAK